MLGYSEGLRKEARVDRIKPLTLVCVRGIPVVSGGTKSERYTAEGVLARLRSGKGRLRVSEGVETVDIKVRLDADMGSTLREVAKRLGVPMAMIIREGIEIRLERLQAQENENYYKEEIDYEKR